MNFTKIVTVAFAVVLLAGCSRTGFHLQPRNDATLPAPSYDGMQHYFLGGIGQRKDIDPVRICGGKDKIVKVESEQSPVNIILSILTFNLYSPRQARVYCRR